MLVEINQLNFEHYRIKFWTERNPVKGGANPGTDRGRGRNSSRKGLDSLSHYLDPVRLAGTLPQNPSLAVERASCKETKEQC